MRGTIKKITRDREYGFIRAEDGVDYFFHQNELHGGLVFKDIHEGDAVKFEPTQAERGPRATDIWPAVTP
ncbi:MAG TPA: cold shock domain-containing protein [Gemmatimonadaceae bacterium]|nr:cold shock domain-containing protein [Gemmatimonadaceae bacterium]